MNFMFVNLDKFLERGYITPEELLELRTQNLRSEDTRDHKLIEDTVKTQMAKMIETGKSPYNSQHTWKSVTNFLDSQGLELHIRAEYPPRRRARQPARTPKRGEREDRAITQKMDDDLPTITPQRAAKQPPHTPTKSNESNQASEKENKEKYIKIRKNTPSKRIHDPSHQKEA